MLHKLARFYYQAVFASQVIQENMFRVSCLGIWQCHDIWISEKLKSEYLKNEKSFRSEIKTFLLVSQVLSFRHTKETSKNVADTTFEDFPIKNNLHKDIEFISKGSKLIANKFHFFSSV